MSFIITGTGRAVPERTVTNDELSTMMETSDEWISTRTGIRERRVLTHETLLGLPERRSAVLAQNQNAAHQIPLGHDRSRSADAVSVGRIRRPDGQIAVLIAVAAPQFHQLLQFLRAALVQEFPLLHAVHRNDRIPVADRSDISGVLPDRFTDLPGKLPQISHWRIFLKNYLAVLLRIYLQRVALTNPQGAADFLGDYDAAEVVDAPDNACCFHICSSNAFRFVLVPKLLFAYAGEICR